jgi:lipopolysaccharide heptosyltransferase I
MTPPTSLPCIQELVARPSGAPRILLVRLSAVGDCVQTMPLACALRDRFPGAHITWVVEKAAAPLVAANDAVDRLIVLPKRFLYSPSTLRWLKNALGRERIDLTFDPQGLTKSGVVAWLSRAARRIGLARPAAREINPWLQTELVAARAAHRVDRYLELLRPLGIERPAVRFGLRLPADSSLAVPSLGQHGPATCRYVALNPGAGWDSKRWPPERFAEVARHLKSRGLASIITWGGPQERTWAEAIVAASAGAAGLAPPTSLLELATLLRGARLFIGSDTGPLHLAAALGTPCLALFGASEAAACGPYGRGHLCLQAAFDSSAGRKRRGADNWAMRRISADLVCKAACHLLDRQDREMAA